MAAWLLLRRRMTTPRMKSEAESIRYRPHAGGRGRGRCHSFPAAEGDGGRRAGGKQRGRLSSCSLRARSRRPRHTEAQASAPPPQQRPKTFSKWRARKAARWSTRRCSCAPACSRICRERKAARVQLERLQGGRERLLESYEIVRRTPDEATSELSGSGLKAAKQVADAALRGASRSNPRRRPSSSRPKSNAARRRLPAGR